MYSTISATTFSHYNTITGSKYCISYATKKENKKLLMLPSRVVISFAQGSGADAGLVRLRAVGAPNHSSGFTRNTSTLSPYLAAPPHNYVRLIHCVCISRCSAVGDVTCSQSSAVWPRSAHRGTSLQGFCGCVGQKMVFFTAL